MSIKSYFAPVKRSEPTDNLEEVLPVSTALAVRKEIEEASSSKKRGAYGKLSTETRAKIAKYAAENGIAAAIRHYEVEEGLYLKESTVRGWKKDHCLTIARISRSQDGRVPDVKEPIKRAPGRPLLLGQEVEEKAKAVILNIRDSGGVINNSVVIGIIKGIIRDSDSNLLVENGGPLQIDKPIARRLLGRLNFVKRRGSTKAKLTPEDFSQLKDQFLSDIRTIVHFDNSPPGLILNWDHTGINYVPTSSWTLQTKGATKVPITAIDDKRQITAVFTCSARGDFLPPQLIYAGKTPACLQRP